MSEVVPEAGIKFVESITDFTVIYTAYYILLEKVWDGKMKQALKIRLNKMYNNVHFKQKCKKQVCSCGLTRLLTISLKDGFVCLAASWLGT